MKPFPAVHHLQSAFQWVNANVSGECSILVALPCGVAVYVCMGRALPIWRSLYGPTRRIA